jgi:dCMP deaminase
MDQAAIDRCKRPEEDWHRFFMDVAVRVAGLSKDPDRKVGAVLVSPDRRQISIGYNGFPAEMPDRPDWLADKAVKLSHMVHAEENCISQAPFNASDCTIYVTRFPCQDCATQWILNAGIKHVVAPRPDFGHLRWGESWIHALAALRHAHINVTYMEEPQ